MITKAEQRRLEEFVRGFSRLETFAFHLIYYFISEGAMKPSKADIVFAMAEYLREVEENI